MPKQKIESLMTELHESFGDQEPTAAQKKLLMDIKSHMHDVLGPEPSDPTIPETLEALFEQIKIEHPKASTVIREIMKTLNNIGI